ncbi:MFS transporter [Frigidibacter sp. MR17.14]|uniref:MFS transporter n=1 Tax=Frigidibacter sp. MR17.14 TaxID=3126509 RepID=UPI0030131A0F
MAHKYLPTLLRHVPLPGVRAFATLYALDSAVRAMLVSVWPIAMYRAIGSAQGMSLAYFAIGCLSLAIGLMVPWAARFIPRRWLYSAGCALHLAGPGLAIFGPEATIPLALLLSTAATVTVFVCLNAYVMDYIQRADLSRGENLKVFYSALPWTVGPMAGIWLHGIWAPLPYLITIGFSVMLTAVFWRLRLGNGKQIARARGPAPNPLAYLGRFMRQPRLVAGWLFAVIRSCGWWVYVVYLPVFCIETGLGEQTGGIALSLTNLMMFAAPLMLRWVTARGVRIAVRSGFAASGGLFLLATFGVLAPPVALVALFAATFFLIFLDCCGGLPFLMAVKPSERSEMAAVYSSFRDVSGILTPGLSWAVLAVTPLAGVFAACGLALIGAFAIAGRLHPRLGQPRRGSPATA